MTWHIFRYLVCHGLYSIALLVIIYQFRIYSFLMWTNGDIYTNSLFQLLFDLSFGLQTLLFNLSFLLPLVKMYHLWIIINKNYVLVNDLKERCPHVKVKKNNQIYICRALGTTSGKAEVNVGSNSINQLYSRIDKLWSYASIDCIL